MLMLPLVLLVGKAERTRERLKGDYRFSWGDVPGEGESSKEEGTGRRGQLRAQKTIPTSARHFTQNSVFEIQFSTGCREADFLAS